MIFEAIEFQPAVHHRSLHSQQLHQQQLPLPPSPPSHHHPPELKSLDFSLTKRLLAAVFFLLVIYAWKQYLEDGEESDTIYI